MDYKETLNLPRTDFPMKGNLPQKEPGILKDWEGQEVYKKIRRKRKGRPKYILHDGPPYANGYIHLGHVLNKTLKDIVLKFKTMRGFDVPYVPGWDCHGMPIEHQLFKELGKTKHDIDHVKFRNLAHEFAMKFVEIQKRDFKRLGIFGEWENPYLTLDPKYEKEVIASFNKLYSKGYIYRGLKPINWCARCETALAEAEVEYEDHISPSIYVKFVAGLKTFLVWTTTPWTLVSNVAIALHPDLTYLEFKTKKGEAFVFAEDLIESLRNKLGLEGEIVKRIKGNQLEGVVAAHPFLSRSSKVILADFVSNEEGTGCVHIAPGHGQEDYAVGLKYNLPVIMSVDDKGCFGELPDCKIPDSIKGKNVFEANDKIIGILKKSGALLLFEKTQHSYPHCWRCHQPLIFRATKQWFLGVDKNNLRQETLREIKKIKWIPDIGERRISSMIELRPDWCLSRQRYWGVPIPIFYCTSCDIEIINERIAEKVESIIQTEGSNAWFLKRASEFLPKGFKCPKCGNKEFRKETDLLDVWFESGASHQGVLKGRQDLGFPSDLYLEGSDQHRGWFQTSILIAMGVSGKSPFKGVFTHGFTVDGQGKKMSKSAGNVIAPQEILDKKGADVLRLWTTSASYFEDVRISEEILERTVDSYRKFRNTAKFLLGNIYDFNIERHGVEKDRLFEIDRWALSRANRLIEDVTRSYENFLFHEATASIYRFCIMDLSSFYLDILKDRLYTFGTDSVGRRSAQTALYRILDILVRILAPLLPFTSEEIWRHFKKCDSVHLSDWPEVDRGLIDLELEGHWERLIQLREMVLKALEEKRASKVIGNSLDAKVIFKVGGEEYKFLDTYKDALSSIFIVSQVEIERSKKEERVIEVKKADGKKCIRCWNWSTFVGSDRDHPSLCKRCMDVVT